MEKSKDIFLSETGVRSKEAAKALRDWLQDDLLVEGLWMAEDILMGEIWRDVLDKTLRQSRLGILFITADNLKNRSIIREAQRLIRNKVKVCPYVVDFSVHLSDLPSPINRSQAKWADKEGTKALVEAIKSALGKDSEYTLAIAYYYRWEKLESELDKIRRRRRTVEDYEKIIDDFINLFTNIKEYRESIKIEIPPMVDEAIELFNQGKYDSEAFVQYVYDRIEKHRDSSGWGSSVIGNVRGFFTEQFRKSDLQIRIERLESILFSDADPDVKYDLLLKHGEAEELDIYLSYYQKLTDKLREQLA